jgi:hypothetical protein
MSMGNRGVMAKVTFIADLALMASVAADTPAPSQEISAEKTARISVQA